MDSVVVTGPESLPFTTKTNLPVPVKKFYQGEPLALGIAQIFIGMIGIIFGMLIDIVNKRDIFYLIVWMPYWSGILVILHDGAFKQFNNTTSTTSTSQQS